MAPAAPADARQGDARAPPDDSSSPPSFRADDFSELEPLPPPLAGHQPREFQFARKALRRMAIDSALVPPGAADAGWFRPRDALPAVAGSSGGAEAGKESAGSGAASTCLGSSPSLSSAGPVTPIARRATIDVASVASSARMTPLGLPLDPLHDAVDTRSGLPIASLPCSHSDPEVPCASKPFARRARMDGASLGPTPAGKEADADQPHIVERRATDADLPGEVYVVDRCPGGGDGRLGGPAPASEESKRYAPVPSVRERDVDCGRVLGTGGFCEVRVVGIRGRGKDAMDFGDAGRRYAMKYLSPTKAAPPPAQDGRRPHSRNKQFERGVADLALEARFLALLRHDNIIALHYVGAGELEEQYNCREGEGREEDDDCMWADAEEGCGYRHRFGFFLMLDPLYETLAARIDNAYIPQMFDGDVPTTAARGARRSSGWWRKVMAHNKRQPSSEGCAAVPLDAWRAQLAQRLEGLKDVASALAYLHDKKIVYRDVKPDNIGFYRDPHLHCHCGTGSDRVDVRETKGCTCYTEVPKLFDFGLAKELKPRHLKDHPHHGPDDREDTYKLTARSGSRRYMAPEVFFSTPYNDKADVYSFGVMLYQVASLVTPFDGYSLYRHEEEVLCSGGRPDVQIPNAKNAAAKIKKSGIVSHAAWLAEEDAERRWKYLALRTKCAWTFRLKKLIHESWNDDMRCRPTTREVATRLEGIVDELRGLAGQVEGAAGGKSIANDDRARTSKSASLRRATSQTEWSSGESDA